MYERVMPEGFKRRIETGLENMMKEGRLKSIVGEMKLPKEVVNYIMAQMDETKHSALKIVARETRLFLEKTNISEELLKLLTQISFEIKTQVRFVPNDRPFKKGDKLKLEVDGPKIKGSRNTPEEPADENEPAIDDEKA